MRDSTFSLYEAQTPCFNLPKSFLIDDNASLQADLKDIQDVLWSLKTLFKVFFSMVLDFRPTCRLSQASISLAYPVIIFMS